MGKWKSSKKVLGICDISGLKVERSRMLQTWDGLWVHPKYYDPKHPQIDGPPSNITDGDAVPNARPYQQSIAYEIIEGKRTDGTEFGISYKETTADDWRLDVQKIQIKQVGSFIDP